MKYCIECTKDTTNNTLTIAGEWGIENIVFICDETQQKLICAPFVKANIAVSNSGGNTVITILSGAGVMLGSDDMITFMIDDFKSSQDIIDGVNENLGSKNVGDMTIRGLLAAIKSDALTLAQLTAAKDAITALIGAASDSSAASTVFGKIAASKELIDAISASLGTDADSRTIQQKCSEMLQIVGTFAQGYVIEQNEDGEDTYSIVIDESAFIEGNTVNIS
jgi:hypothetical protein